MQYGQSKNFIFISFLLIVSIFNLTSCASKSTNKNLVLEGNFTEESGTLDPAFKARQKKAEENFFTANKPSSEEKTNEDDEDFIEDIPFDKQILNGAAADNLIGGFAKFQLIWPTTGKYSSMFGPRKLGHVRKMHTGIDISAATGTPIHAAADGQILFAGKKRGYGQAVIIAHNGNHETLYAHMSRMIVHNGQFVHRNQVIGFVGKTGHVTGANLHFETRVNGIAYNPMLFLPAGYSGSIHVGMKTPSYAEQIAYYQSTMPMERIAYSAPPAQVASASTPQRHSHTKRHRVKHKKH